MATKAEAFELSVESAELYEDKFVPGLFAEWAEWVVDAAGPQHGQSVLDVACGTGIVARTIAERVGPSGRVVGVDLNPAMLAVAQRLRPDLEWQEADAAELPFSASSFDLVLCEAALMFFPDRVRALAEMARVLGDDGTVVVQAWSKLERQPGYGPFIDVAVRHAGPAAAELLGSYWAAGDTAALRDWSAAAGLEVKNIDTRMGTVRFASIDEFVRAEVEGTPLIERISEEVYRRIIADARRELAGFTTVDGRTAVPIEGHIVTAIKEGRRAGRET